MNSYFICATQPTNLGDLVINKMLVDELCRYGKVFVDAYGLPEEFTKYLFDEKIAEFAIILELNGYSDCLKIR